MKRQIVLTRNPIDEAALLQARQASTKAGASLTFAGIVRAEENSITIKAIDYEAYQEMAVHQFHKLLDAVEAQWPIESLRLIHRIGAVKVNETSLWIEVVSGHRKEAFAAAQWLIDEMKKTIPIWKRPLPTAS